MLVSVSENTSWYILLFFISFCITIFSLRREFKQSGCMATCCAAGIISAIGGLVLYIFLITFSSTYYVVEGNGKCKEYHIMYSFISPNGEKIYTYGGKKYCYNMSHEEFKIRSLTYLPFKPLYGTNFDKIEKIVKPYDFFVVDDNIDVLYFWKAPKSISEKRNSSQRRCIFMPKEANAIELE